MTYTIVEDTCIRSKDTLLIDYVGYSNVMKRQSGQSTARRLIQRLKNTNCCATVRQIGDLYLPGSAEHIHPPRPDAEIVASIVHEAKMLAQ